jgi:NADH-quinone oxidoreductase subunit F
MEKPLTQDIREDRTPLTLQEYEAKGGYEALKYAVSNMKPSEVTQEVKNANLKGRGGAGFPLGMKWGFVDISENAPKTKYLIANADEMEPGTFKDRLLMEGNPHQLIEGMLLAAYAIQANVSFIFLRWAYREANDRLKTAIREAEEAGYLGQNILGSDWSLEMHIHTSVGRYMCGEETGLLNALEGKRATPRAKPPFPQAVGLFGKPTIVNNVESLCAVPHIVKNGADWFLSLSISDEGGTKLYGVSGNVKNPGVWELPLGTSMRTILEDYAGGMKDGYQFRAALPGGASTDLLTTDHLDDMLDYQTAMSNGSRLGTGMLIVLDDQTSVVGFVANLESFFAQESCGWCTPCRDGIPYVQKTLRNMYEGNGKPGDIEILEEHTNYLAPGKTFCAFAPGAMEPLQSALKYFREDFEACIPEPA